MNPYLIFDFDGTMVQSKMAAVQIFNQLSEKYCGRTLDDQELAELWNLSIQDRFRALKVPLYKLPALVIEGKREYQKLVTDMQPIDGLRDILFELKEIGYSLAILSSNTTENIQRFLDEYQLPQFEFVHSATNIFGKDKAIKEIAKKHSIDRSQIIYVGDELRDVQACKKAGVKMIAVTWGYDSAALLAEAHPDYLCDSIADFMCLLRKEGQIEAL